MERRTRCHLALLPCLLVVLASLVVASEVTSPVAPAGFDHTLWTRVLQSYASTAKIDGIQETVVDYETLRRRADPDFANYLDKLADFDPATLSGSREETLAFWLNAYNAFAVRQVVNNPCRVVFGKFCWPARSIRALGGLGQKNWDVPVGKIGNRDYTLRQIQAVVGSLNDSRAWSCMVSACVSCPSLLNAAYLPQTLDAQMNLSAALYLNDTGKGLSLDRNGLSLKLSPIFEWNRDAIARQHGSVINYILTYMEASPATKLFIATNANRLKVSYFDYKWELNSFENSLLRSPSFW